MPKKTPTPSHHRKSGEIMLPLSPDLSLPRNAVTQRMAFLGTSGSGKTYGAGKLAECMLEIGAQIIVIDTVGNWWGLRVHANGHSPGYQIPVIGGERGDLPLDPLRGKEVAELAVETRSSMVIDISDLTEAEVRRWIIDFATRFHALKKHHKSPVEIFWEECQDIIPQQVYGEDAKMVGAVQRLVKRGRNFGIGTVLISQRAADVNKKCLNLVETLFVFRTGGAQDRDTIEKWASSHATKAIDLIDTLPELRTGEPYCWSRSWLGVTKQIKIGKKSTFDASATPDFDDEAATAAPMAPIDLELFKTKLGAVIAEAKANDPAELKKRIHDLELRLKKADGSGSDQLRERAMIDNVIAERDAMFVNLQQSHERHAETDRKLQLALDDMRLIEKRANIVANTASDIVATAERFFMDVPSPPPLRPPTSAVSNGKVVHGTRVKATPAQAKSLRNMGSEAGMKQKGDDFKIGKLAKRILTALAQFPDGVSTVKLGLLAVSSSKGGHFQNTVREIRNKGLAACENDTWTLTPAGLYALGDWTPLPTGPDLYQYWMNKLSKAERGILAVIFDVWPDAMTNVEISEASGYSGGHFENSFRHLRKLDLVVGKPNAWKLDDSLRGYREPSELQERTS